MDAHDHVYRVLNIVRLFNIPRVLQDAVLLRVFPFTLTRFAKRWVDRLAPGAVNTLDLFKKPLSKGPQLDKECPLNEEVKQVEEVKYNKFGRPAPFDGNNRAKFLIGASVNVMPRNTFEYSRLVNLRNTNMLVELADMTKKAPLGLS
uniref:Reverse transcriptase domain-containing protein n=1 Tax=Tanacetum cinerariifolium TaxID=118510 RepID=A0A699GIS1_TANCI|nr:hypothetical protein [Tanacetum cinerariifolium]